jgi:hypothetical protein
VLCFINRALHLRQAAPSAVIQPKRTESHIQCLCLGFQEARIRALHKLAQRLWKDIRDVSKLTASKGQIITVNQTVAWLQGLQEPEELIDDCQQAWDEIADMQLDGEGDHVEVDAVAQRKRRDST